MNNQYKLTGKVQRSHTDKDKKHRHYDLYFLNNVLILKHKIPFDVNYNSGVQLRTSVWDVYLLNGRIHQKRCKNYYDLTEEERLKETREVSFPVSKRLLKQLNVPNDLKIEYEEL